MSTILNVLRPVVRSAIKPIDSRGGVSFAYNMDGIDDRFVLANRAVNPDGDNSFTFYTGDAGKGGQVIVSQNITGTFELQEFRMFTSTFMPMQLQVIFGGVSNFLGIVEPDTKYTLDLIGSTFSLKDRDGNVIRSGGFIKGAAREPAAVTKIGCSTDGVGNFNFFKGIQRDIKVNGTLWPMADRNQSIQLPSPTGLGSELITPTVLENPAVKGSQWTYLGAGRWQYVGDGTLNALQFLAFADQPVQGYFEFEVESFSGAGNLTCAVTSGGNPVNSTFNSVGVKRYYYLSKGVGDANAIQLKRVSGTASCIIKNISFKSLGTCNPMTGVNLNPDRWQEVPL